MRHINIYSLATLGLTLLIAGQTAQAEEEQQQPAQEKSCPADTPCHGHVQRDDLLVAEPYKQELSEKQYPDYLQQGSEVQQVETGPDLRRDQPYTNNPYK